MSNVNKIAVLQKGNQMHKTHINMVLVNQTQLIDIIKYIHK